jgi:hypothetical protein
MEVTTVVIDNFLPNPDLVREQVVKLPFYENKREYPGLRSDAADDEYQQFFRARVSKILNVTVSEFIYDSFCFQLVYEDINTWIHKDGCDWAGVLYLTPNAITDSGTALYNESNSIVTTIGNIYNRLVLYKGNINHSSMIPGFGNSPETGRLTQVFFFNAESDIKRMA